MFTREADCFVGTELTQGGWYPDQANGGTVLALLGHCMEEVPTLVPMTMARVTADLMRPVPVGRPLRVESTVVREGKKLQILELRLLVGGVEHVRLSVLRLREADLSARDDMPTSTTTDRPADALMPPDASRSLRGGEPGSGCLWAVDMRHAVSRNGSTLGTWLRLDSSVLEGEPVRPSARLMLAFDFANQVGLGGFSPTITLINPDVSAHVLRAPVGEWIALTGDTRFNHVSGRGVSQAVLSDDDGPFAVASLSQLVQPRKGNS